MQKYDNVRTAIGKLEGTPPSFVPNKFFADLLGEESSKTSENDKLIIATAVAKYGNGILELGSIMGENQTDSPDFQTARASFIGPSIVFGGITKRFQIDAILRKAFGENDARDILSLAWYFASEGSALSNSNVWLDHFDNPRGKEICSQDITRLLDRMDTDGIMTFYKYWLENFEMINDRVLYDLTSISWTGKSVDLANWGHNRDCEKLPQVNFALLCARKTSMPLFAWPLDGSISDTRTLQNTLQFLEKLGYHPNCLMMDRGFASRENITYMFQHGHTFLQALRLNADWIRKIIDAGRLDRLSPNSKLKVDNRTYYTSTSLCHWIVLKKQKKKGSVEEIVVNVLNGSSKSEEYADDKDVEIISQHMCMVHVLFCQDLVGNQWDRFMDSLKIEYDRLLSNESATVKKEFAPYFKIEKPKYARHRTVGFNIENIEKHRDHYAGHICFITNDKTIQTAEVALHEYSTRDYIEKDFDELKNDLDMNRIRVHSDGRMCARLLIQFIAHIILREILVRLKESEECKKMTRKQISSCIKTIYKITFKDKHNDVKPELSKSQRAILEALGFTDNR
jgi:transposase